MFQSMKNINSAFSHIRILTVVICIGAFSLSAYAVSKMAEANRMSKQEMLVIDMDGNLYNGTASTRESNIEIEARAHVLMFHELFFSFDPERAVINERKEKWVYLADNSAGVLFDQLEESGFFQNIIVSSISARLKDVETRIEQYDGGLYLSFEFSAKQKLMRSSSTSFRNLKTSGRLRILDNRSPNNAHGFMIENITIIDNSTIK